MFAVEVDRVFDGERVIPGGALVTVAGSRISEVAPRGTPPPGEYEVTRFPDATLMPGLIDSHVHLCCDSGPGALDRLSGFTADQLVAVIERALRAHLASGVTTVRDLGDCGWAVIDWRDQNRADTTLPSVLGSGPPITSPNGHCSDMGGAAEGVDQLRQAVAERSARGVDIVKIMASGGAMSPGTDVARPQFSAEEIREAGLSYGEAARTYGRLHKAGVRMVSGSDGGISPAKRHEILPDPVIQLVEGGVSTVDALATATSIAAEACGVGDRKGRLSVGFDADLLVVGGDPLTDITTLRNVQAVYVRGDRRV